MCIICIDLAKKKITSTEAVRNLFEMAEDMEDEHIQEVLDKIEERECEED
jgi:hypothetical protein